MPIYEYKCNNCEDTFTEAHSHKVKSKGCKSCKSDNVQKTLPLFASKTDRTVEKLLETYTAQGHKDLERYAKDDKFAANVSGASDRDHEAKLQKVLQEAHAKNEKSRKALKRVKE